MLWLTSALSEFTEGVSQRSNNQWVPHQETVTLLKAITSVHKKEVQPADGDHSYSVGCVAINHSCKLLLFSGLPENVHVRVQYLFRSPLTLMPSSFQNVNIHRTPEDALQTVPPHLWSPAVTHSGCRLLPSLTPFCWILKLVSLYVLLTVLTVWLMCLLLILPHLCCTHTHLCNTFKCLVLKELSLSTSYFESYTEVCMYVYFSVLTVLSSNDHMSLWNMSDMLLYCAILPLCLWRLCNLKVPSLPGEKY